MSSAFFSLATVFLSLFFTLLLEVFGFSALVVVVVGVVEGFSLLALDDADFDEALLFSVDEVFFSALVLSTLVLSTSAVLLLLSEVDADVFDALLDDFLVASEVLLLASTAEGFAELEVFFMASALDVVFDAASFDVLADLLFAAASVDFFVFSSVALEVLLVEALAAAVDDDDLEASFLPLSTVFDREVAAVASTSSSSLSSSSLSSSYHSSSSYSLSSS